MQDRLAPDLWQKKQEVMNMSIELSHDELLVLYDLLHRLEDVEEIFEDPSEQEVLWHIQTQLEKELVEPFQADYQAIIEEARRAVTEQY
jgi:ethanolamine ammonia-lyase large subunit